jgi:hypothetical protein
VFWVAMEGELPGAEKDLRIFELRALLSEGVEPSFPTSQTSAEIRLRVRSSGSP